MLFDLNRSIAMTLSFPLDKNFAEVGESGSMNRISGVTATVKHPMNIKILRNQCIYNVIIPKRIMRTYPW
jgi:hypothetical protein